MCLSSHTGWSLLPRPSTRWQSPHTATELSCVSDGAAQASLGRNSPKQTSEKTSSGRETAGGFAAGRSERKAQGVGLTYGAV